MPSRRGPADRSGLGRTCRAFLRSSAPHCRRCGDDIVDSEQGPKTVRKDGPRTKHTGGCHGEWKERCGHWGGGGGRGQVRVISAARHVDHEFGGEGVNEYRADRVLSLHSAIDRQTPHEQLPVRCPFPIIERIAIKK